MTEQIKRTNFWSLLTTEQGGLKIEIPTIQRDYVQGSDAAKSEEIPQLFIKNIHNALAIPDGKLSLEFVYGHISNQKLHLLDGQQRLTTLFLVHYYLFLATCPPITPRRTRKQKEIERKWRLRASPLHNFSYATRSNTKDFCDCLLRDFNADLQTQPIGYSLNPIAMEEKKDQIKANKLPGYSYNKKYDKIFYNLSAQIKDKDWFNFPQDDPTISSMLNMLDIIQQEFSSEEDAAQKYETFLDRLTGSNCPIVFNFLNMGVYKLSDELYLKMNSRGKPLTDYEIFKSKLTEWLPEEEKILSSKNGLFTQTAEYKLDNDWQNIFWEIAQGYELAQEKAMSKQNENAGTRLGYTKQYIRTMDQMQLRFVQQISFLLFLQRLIRENATTTTLPDFQLLNQAKELFADANSTDRNTLLYTFEGIYNFYNNYKEVKNHPVYDKIYASFYKILITESTQITYSDRLKLFVLILFWQKQGNCSQIDMLIPWFRVCYNLIVNTNIDEGEQFQNAFKSMDVLWKDYQQSNKPDFYKFLSTYTQNIAVFNQDQVKEEKEKSCIIAQQKGISENILIEAENHAYFDGKIGFILEFSKDSNFQYRQKEFQTYYSKFSQLFSESLYPLFQRALLTCGNTPSINDNYIPPKGKGFSFGTLESAIRTKKDTWHKVFDSSPKYALLKTLADKLPDNFTSKNLEDICHDFCAKLEDQYDIFSNVKAQQNLQKVGSRNSSQKWIFASCYADWRYLFVKNGIYKNGEIRGNENYVIFNNKKTDGNWNQQAELYTCAFSEYVSKNNVYNWECKYLFGRDKQFCIYIQNHAYRLSYNTSFTLKRYEKKDDKWYPNPNSKEVSIPLLPFPNLAKVIADLIKII